MNTCTFDVPTCHMINPPAAREPPAGKSAVQSGVTAPQHADPSAKPFPARLTAARRPTSPPKPAVMVKAAATPVVAAPVMVEVVEAAAAPVVAAPVAMKTEKEVMTAPPMPSFLDIARRLG